MLPCRLPNCTAHWLFGVVMIRMHSCCDIELQRISTCMQAKQKCVIANGLVEAHAGDADRTLTLQLPARILTGLIARIHATYGLGALQGCPWF